ncbi:hypothetical protein [Deinococcus maricopensis]|uniref:Uncharacterized protein n=1 Tax=Deinococcus maricopensis (strain DSM 21211 / LMG 22137 / NRRL B-23946 / LB-34) TaxID=709986 RepID=E8U835_DEIML|nr:hypothetical protein [Deinococcus maricopensis]ADV67224.1 hypothetical protein Deima_1575 [Deinococcus maricopensis DSM 21211]
MTLPPDLLAYHARLAALRRDLRGATVLHAPGTPLIGANAAYVESDEGLLRARLWFAGQGVPAVFADTRALTGARTVLDASVGTYAPQAAPGSVRVEQTSRLHLRAAADLLARVWDAPDWADPLAAHLSRTLEGARDFTLLLAYDAGEPCGALLLLREGAHVWGVTHAPALPALLNAAADLNGGTVRTTLTPEHPLTLSDVTRVTYSHADTPASQEPT